VTLLLAHGVGSVQDLPVPQWLFLYGAGVVLIASFLALAVLWRRPLLERHADGRPVSPRLSRLLLSRALRLVLGALSFALLVLVLAAALFGARSAVTNIAPTFVYVAFWLGLVPVVVLLGDVWRVLNPWRAAAEAVESILDRVGVRSEALPYPEWLGRWPAAVLLLLFATLELAYHDPADPRMLAIAVLPYSAAMWIGAFLFGSERWFPNGDAFSVYFGLLARLSPFDVRAPEDAHGEREIVVRPPVVSLAALHEPRAGTIAFVAVMLGSVGFDGLSRAPWWQERRVDMSNLEATFFNLAGLVGTVVLVAVAYLGAVAAARAAARAERPLAAAFVASLAPIALVYAVSHYFSLLVIQAQFLVPLASDPFGWGWNLFGTLDFRPNLTPLSPNAVWYVQVATLVAGHVVGLVLAHDRALALFPSAQRALRSQYPLLALMVLYTVGGLWLLSQG
jgi:hypothetical protein